MSLVGPGNKPLKPGQKVINIRPYLNFREAELYDRLNELWDSSEALDKQRGQNRSKAFSAKANGEFYRFENALAEYSRICAVNRGYQQPTDDDLQAALSFYQRMEGNKTHGG